MFYVWFFLVQDRKLYVMDHLWSTLLQGKIMDELLLGYKKRIPGSDGKIEFSNIPPASWTNASVLSTSLKAPNGDDCAEWRSDGSSCLRMDLSTVTGDDSFSIGFYYRPTSYQEQYGTAPPSARIFQLDSFTSARQIGATVLPGTGSSSQPLFDGLGYGTKVGYSSHRSLVNDWYHFLLSYDRNAKILRAFFDGVKFLQDTAEPVLSMMMSLGGIGDRAGQTGPSQARYGFRGYMSTPRHQRAVVENNFNPLDW